jgi:hypothetical protein
VERILELAKSRERIEQDDDWIRLRRGLRLIEREKTRKQGERSLEKISERRRPDLSPIALCGLASSAVWSHDPRQALYRTRQVLSHYPMSAAAVWCSHLTIQIFRMLGMRRERFEAERERFRIMQKIAFYGDDQEDRIYALLELMKECESRDLAEDAQRCAEELRDLIRSNGDKIPSQLA